MSYILFALNKSLSNLLTSSCVCCVQDEDLDFTLATDFETGHYFRERIIPRAVLYFTGEALEDDESVSIFSKLTATFDFIWQT